MEETNQKRKPRTPPWIIGGVALALLALLVVLQTSNIWKSFTIESASDTLALYALTSLNFVAFIVFAFIFIRNLLKLLRERRSLALGSQLKTRLLVFFIAVSLLPLIAMAVFSYFFMNRALDRWFTEIPVNVVREAQLVQKQAIEDQTVKLAETARMLAASLENRTVTDSSLEELVREGNLTRLEVAAKNGQILAQSARPLSPEQESELSAALAFVRQGKSDEPFLHDGKGFDVAVAAFKDGRRLVVVPDLRPEGNVSQVVENSLVEFDRLKQRQIEARRIGLSTLGLLTFLLMFASTWTAFYVARGLTVPIKALAEGAGEIARGNFAHRVSVFAEDELALLVSVFNQMSSRIEANSAELRERRKYIETVLQSLSTGVISFDAVNRVTTINKAAAQMLKLEHASFEGFTLEQLISEENRAVLEKLLARAKRAGQASEQTVLRRENPDGSPETGETIPVALAAAALPATAAGETSGVVLVIEDLTELLQAQRASAWSEVARRMAHEIKNPLTPIQLSAERIAKRVNAELTRPNGDGAGEKIADKRQISKIINESTDTILREVSSLKGMVDEFSRFARLPNVRLESGDAGDVARQAVALYEDRAGDVKIETNLAENLPAAMIDAEQLRRVFVNLIENALEAFSDEQTEKRIIIATRHDAARELIVVEVADNGVGIAASDFQKLFQPYFSTKGRGTGLGLAIVQRIIIEHGGKIKAVNNPPRGAKFIVELPVSV